MQFGREAYIDSHCNPSLVSFRPLLFSYRFHWLLRRELAEAFNPWNDFLSLINPAEIPTLLLRSSLRATWLPGPIHYFSYFLHSAYFIPFLKRKIIKHYLKSIRIKIALIGSFKTDFLCAIMYK